MTELRVRQGNRFGTCIAVYRYAAVVQWEGKGEKDVAWIHDLEVIGIYDGPIASR